MVGRRACGPSRSKARAAHRSSSQASVLSARRRKAWDHLRLSSRDPAPDRSDLKLGGQAAFSSDSTGAFTGRMIRTGRIGTGVLCTMASKYPVILVDAADKLEQEIRAGCGILGIALPDVGSVAFRLEPDG